MASPVRRLWVVVLVAGIAGLGAWLSAQRRAARVQAPVDFADGRPKLLDFGMGICAQCKRMQVVMRRAQHALGRRLDVRSLDIRRPPGAQLAERYHMRLIPLVVLAGADGAELWRHEGFIDFPSLARVVAERLPQP